MEEQDWDVGTAQIDTVTEPTVSGFTVTGEGDDAVLRVILPNLLDKKAVTQLQEEGKQYREKHGMKAMLIRLGDLIRHLNYVDSDINLVKTSANTINGVRTVVQHKGDSKKSFQHTAQAFYDGLSVPLLRQHCQMFHMDYDQFNTIDEVVQALVQRHIHMSNGQH